MLLPLPVCLQSCFRQCQHVLAPTGALLCCCLTEYTGCCVAAGCEGQWRHLRETEEQTGSERAGQYSAGCSLPQSVLWQLSGRELLLCSWSSGHERGWRNMGPDLCLMGSGSSLSPSRPTEERTNINISPCHFFQHRPIKKKDR